MANHALPTTTSLYTDVLTNIKDRIDDSLKMLDSVNTTPTSVPTNAVRWNSTTFLWEKYNGSTWASLASSYAIQVLKSTNIVGGNSSTLLGAIPYQSNTDTSTLLAPNTTTTRKFLRQTGTGTNGDVPVWDTLLAADIPVLDTSKITTGTLPVLRGGTGVTTSTGTGSVVLSASPTFTGTVTAPTFSGALTGNATTATTASDSNKLNGRTFNWSGQSGQPNWVWGGRDSDPNNMYVWNPSNFNVAYATNATNVSGGYGMFSGLITTKVTNASFAGANDHTLSVRGDATYPASMSFHRAGAFAVNFGLDTDNKLKVGGWSMGSVYEIYHQGNPQPSTTYASAFTTAVGSAPSYACRAWVNFNGTGTVAIRASGNVSSITDNGAGDYTVNFTTAMPDVNYCCNGTCHGGNSAGSEYAIFGLSNAITSNIFSLSNIRITIGYVASNVGDGALLDHDKISVSIFR